MRDQSLEQLDPHQPTDKKVRKRNQAIGMRGNAEGGTQRMMASSTMAPPRPIASARRVRRPRLIPLRANSRCFWVAWIFFME